MSQAILKDKLVLLTAGPTKEAIDPVRFISNHSSGKMGYAIAEEFLQQGAKLVLVSGPVPLMLSHPNLTLLPVASANEMYLACCHYFEPCDIAVFSAAVADYRPKRVAAQKIKKEEASFVIEMVKNIDIAAEFGKYKQPHQISVGFALETNDEYNHALGKLHRKNFDAVVLNSMNDAGATFGHDTNKISIITRALHRKDFPLKSKAAVAKDIVRSVSELVMAKQPFEELIKVA
jgi:phosphopantothenoylcysteine decarboxylase / phosphopantothenate---cysteine ligase